MLINRASECVQRGLASEAEHAVQIERVVGFLRELDFVPADDERGGVAAVGWTGQLFVNMSFAVIAGCLVCKRNTDAHCDFFRRLVAHDRNAAEGPG